MIKTNSIYTLNKKDPNAIVYPTADGKLVRVTREDFPSEEAFLAFKAWSDEGCTVRVAMYLRLSSEDGGLKDTGKAESESISNQRGLIENFIRSRSKFSGWEICEFCDDGWSGKNFDRPSVPVHGCSLHCRQ